MKKTFAFILIFILLQWEAAVCFAETAEELSEPPVLTAEEASAAAVCPALEEAPAVEETTPAPAAPEEISESQNESEAVTLLAAHESTSTNGRVLLEVPVGEDGRLICYAAGIPETEKERIAEKIQSSFPDGKLEDPALTDAEKRTLITDPEDDDCDSLMCWAAAISDTVWATGWGENLTNPITKMPFTSEDDLMHYFVQSFTDGGNWMQRGLQWLFDGVSLSENPPGFGWARLKKDESEADALARDYCAGKLITVTEISCDEGNIAALDSLREGVPVNVSVEFCNDEDKGTTHAMAAMGIIVDPAAEGTDDYYRYILLADSDNSVDGYEGTAPDTRPNTLTSYPLRVITTQTGTKVWEVAGLVDDPYISYTRLKSICSLAAYGSEEAAAAIETDPQATKNALNTQDLVLESIFTSLEKGTATPVIEFEHGSSVWLNFTTVNASYQSCKESFPALVTLKREADGETVSFYAECNPGGFIYALDSTTDSVQLNNYMVLKSGKYSVRVELNPASADKRLTEAYYLNNLSLTQFFTILAAKPEPDPLPGCLFPMLIPDNSGIFVHGTCGYSILVCSGFSAFDGLEVMKDLPDGRWERVDPKDYTLSDAGAASFRLTFRDGYLETLGEGTHRFRFTLGGIGYCCDLCCVCS